MAYTTIDDPVLFFNTVLYTGDGNDGRTVTGVGFQPDWVWLKSRSEAEHHTLNDSVRGANKQLYSHLTYSEATDTDRLQSFDSDGFTLGTDVIVNKNTETFVSWNWKAGTSFTNDASATSVGTIDSTGSFNNDSGFSIVSYTNTNQSANSGVATIKHGLNTTPNVMILKDRDATSDWQVFHSSLPTNKYLDLNTTDAAAVDTNVWNNTAPTSSVFTVGDNSYSNPANRAMIAYCFAEKEGYSKFGSYTGNGHASDGPYIYLGFRPAIVITKKTDGADDWRIFDNKRSSSGFNPVDKHIYPYSSGAEASSSTSSVPDGFDFLSNGFKIRQASAGINADGGSYVYLAFAESPFVNSNKVPNNAR